MHKESRKLSRDWLANPNKDIPLQELWKKNNSVVLTDNKKIIDLGNGYDIIKPIDTSKKFK
ncbi:hypothetical protein [Paenibacillus daejeonensis]|uniref:hypothetical protein n=1 Tax=Paenibacillus daejeonensis TaxID=135193 RepID=UPI0003621A43|nr:hypothetical protein [Paenibacillus daejeonensis]